MNKNVQKIGLSVMGLSLGLSVLPVSAMVTGNPTGVIEAEAASYKNSLTHSLKMPENLKSTPNFFGRTVMKLPRHAKVSVKFKVGAYSYVKVNGKGGYLKSSNLRMLPSRYA